MNAYIIIRDKTGEILTIPQVITSKRGKVFPKHTKYVGTFWASTWKEAKEIFIKYLR